MFKLLSLTALILSLSMPLWAGEGDVKEGEPAAKSVPPKAPKEGKGEMEDVPLDEGNDPKKKVGGCILF